MVLKEWFMFITHCCSGSGFNQPLQLEDMANLRSSVPGLFEIAWSWGWFWDVSNLMDFFLANLWQPPIGNVWEAKEPQESSHQATKSGIQWSFLGLGVGRLGKERKDLSLSFIKEYTIAGFFCPDEHSWVHSPTLLYHFDPFWDIPLNFYENVPYTMRQSTKIQRRNGDQFTPRIQTSIIQGIATCFFQRSYLEKTFCVFCFGRFGASSGLVFLPCNQEASLSDPASIRVFIIYPCRKTWKA